MTHLCRAAVKLPLVDLFAPRSQVHVAGAAVAG